MFDEELYEIYGGKKNNQFNMSFQPHHLNFFLFFVFFVDNIIRRNEEEIKIYISSNQLLNLYVTVLLQKNIVLFAIFQSF